MLSYQEGFAYLENQNEERQLPAHVTIPWPCHQLLLEKPGTMAFPTDPHPMSANPQDYSLAKALFCSWWIQEPIFKGGEQSDHSQRPRTECRHPLPAFWSLAWPSRVTEPWEPTWLHDQARGLSLGLSLLLSFLPIFVVEGGWSLLEILHL
jgi:hypothetical protein